MFRNRDAARARPLALLRRCRIEPLELRHLLSGTGLPGDANNDGIVNGLDIAIVASNWMHAGAGPLMGDVNADGIVNGLDIADIASHWLQKARAPGDANGDGIVNGLDIAAVASHWLQTGSQPLMGDANSDGKVNGLDIADIASHWLRMAIPPSIKLPDGPLAANEINGKRISGISVADGFLLSNGRRRAADIRSRERHARCLYVRHRRRHKRRKSRTTPAAP